MDLSRLLVAIEGDHAEERWHADKLAAVRDRKSARLRALYEIMVQREIAVGHYGDTLYRADPLFGGVLVEKSTRLGDIEVGPADVPDEVRELPRWDEAAPGIPARDDGPDIDRVLEDAGRSLEAALTDAAPPVVPTWAFPRNYTPETDTPVERLEFPHPDQDDAEDLAADAVVVS